jgi:catalase
MYIPLNKDAYTPNTLNGGSPKQANQTVGNGFFTTPGRFVNGNLVRRISPTFQDVWSQPRLFFNSLVPAEQQFLINAIRFETSNVQSSVVKDNVIIQLNRVSNDLARRVARAIGAAEPLPDRTYYHNNKTANVGVFGTRLKKIDHLKVGVLASVANSSSIAQATGLVGRFAPEGVDIIVVAESLAPGVDQTYSASDATNFDAIVVADGTDSLFAPSSFNSTSASTLYPAGRPLRILVDGYRFGKPVGALGSGSAALSAAHIPASSPGVSVARSVSDDFINNIKDGLYIFKFLDRFTLDRN